ncbi:MAG: hypothetical protein IT463_07555 [Planctomycetes bacterium]|nr:hypothetical protein [Planctomycetota bacterium]
MWFEIAVTAADGTTQTFWVNVYNIQAVRVDRSKRAKGGGEEMPSNAAGNKR